MVMANKHLSSFDLKSSLWKNLLALNLIIPGRPIYKRWALRAALKQYSSDSGLGTYLFSI
jgi:hypothetical protein